MAAPGVARSETVFSVLPESPRGRGKLMDNSLEDIVPAFWGNTDESQYSR